MGIGIDVRCLAIDRCRSLYGVIETRFSRVDVDLVCEMCDIASPNLAKPMTAKESKNQSIMNKSLIAIVSTSQMIVRCERRNARIVSFVISALACVLPALALAQQPATMSANAVAKLPFSPGLQLGDTLYVSGHLGVDPAVGKAPSDPEVEARQVLQSVDQTLKEAGLTMDDLVYVEIYCTDLNLYSTFNKEYRTFFKVPFPARDFIGVKDLLFGAHFEIMGIAVRNASLNKGQPPTAE